jgi:hypothetical protein
MKNILKRLYVDLNTLDPLFKDYWLVIISELLSLFFTLCILYFFNYNTLFFCYNYEECVNHWFMFLTIFIFFFIFYFLVLYELWLEYCEIYHYTVFTVFIIVFKNLIFYCYSHISDFISDDYSEIKFIHWIKLFIFFNFIFLIIIYWCSFFLIYFFNFTYVTLFKYIYLVDLTLLISFFISFFIYVKLILNKYK